MPAEIFLKLNQYEKERINQCCNIKINSFKKYAISNAIRLKTDINVALNKDKEMKLYY